MTMVYTKIYDAPAVNEEEILRYAGMRTGSTETELTTEMKQLLEEVLEEGLSVFEYKVCYTFTENEVMFAATVGEGIEKLSSSYADCQPSRALLLDAFGSERVESLCDAFCRDMGLEKRVSPGYGDWKLEGQREVFELLKPQDNIGVTLDDDFFMSPMKSVTAKAKWTFRCELCSGKRILLDGGMGSMLQANGLKPGERPESWNLSHPEVITQIHRQYYEAGADVVFTNTFGVNGLKYSKEEIEKLVSAALENAHRAAELCSSGAGKKYVALDIGPLGKLLKPFGEVEFEDAVEAFAQTVRAAVRSSGCRPDLVIIETINDAYESKAAVLAVKENCDLPIIVSNAYQEDGKLLTGADPMTMITLLEGLRVDAIGMNCSMGPSQLLPIVQEYIANSSLPVLFMPNAGMPCLKNGETCYDITPEEFASTVAEAVGRGVRLFGGCCGTTPEYIRLVRDAIDRADAAETANQAAAGDTAADEEKAADADPAMTGSGLSRSPAKHRTAVCSYAGTVSFDDGFVKVGERINPTGKARLKKALIDADMSYLLDEAVRQAEASADVLDVNVGIPQIDEKEVLEKAVKEIQAVTSLPLQIDTSDAAAMERAVRIYNGKPMINSVNASAESMAKVFPVAGKYGAVVVALTLDEKGIPETADGRFALAEKIVKQAARYGIDRKDLVFDTLAMAVSAQTDAALASLGAIRRIHDELGCRTILGISNISFGLPKRPVINATFLAMAREAGLSAAILNPFSEEVSEAACCSDEDIMKGRCREPHAEKLLLGKDEGCMEYIAAAQQDSSDQMSAEQKNAAETAAFRTGEGQNASGSNVQGQSAGSDGSSDTNDLLRNAIIHGLKEKALNITGELVKETDGMSIIENVVIPALDLVGKSFETGKTYLPQLLMSAEAANAALGVIKGTFTRSSARSGVTVVLATVKGDIHDIGKNIVRLLLESYGFTVVDIGKDVSPEVIVAKVAELHADAAGLSALMTTTVPAMEETVSQLREKAGWARIIVGGAVLNEEMARQMGADKYSRDAMETVRYLVDYSDENRPS